MKMLIMALSLLSVNLLHAETLLKWQKSTTFGGESWSLSKEQNSYHVKKTSNWYSGPGDYRLGELKISSPTPVKLLLKEITDISKELKDADAKLSSVGSSYNSVNPKAPHLPYFVLGSFEVYESSSLYKKLQGLLTEIEKQPTVLISGISLSPDKKKLNTYSLGKITRSDGFNVKFFCESKSLPTRCFARSWGSFVLEKD